MRLTWNRGGRNAAGDVATTETLQPQKETEMTEIENNHELAISREHERDVTIQAARAFDRAVKERDNLVDQLRDAVAGLKMKNEQLMQKEVDLAEERNRTASYRAEADELVKENERLRVGLGPVRATLTMLVAQLDALDLPAPPEKRRRGGGRSKPAGGDGSVAGGGEAVSDANGGAGEVAEGAPVLAHGE